MNKRIFTSISIAIAVLCSCSLVFANTQDSQNSVLAPLLLKTYSTQHANQNALLNQIITYARNKNLASTELESLRSQLEKQENIDPACAYRALKIVSDILPTLYHTHYRAHHEEFSQQLQASTSTTRGPRPQSSADTGATTFYPATSQLVQAAINNALEDLKTSGSLATNNIIISGSITIDNLSGILKATNGAISAGQVGTSNIEDSAITTAKINDLAVTAGKLAGSIPDSKLNTIISTNKVANSATTATSISVPSTIVLRDTFGGFQAYDYSAPHVKDQSELKKWEPL